MGKPAARVGDMHVCPMATPGTPPIPHVGGPLLPPGAPTVLIGGMPAAVMGGMATCVGPPDSVVLGSTGVFFTGMPAARMGDTCAHGGTIVMGLPTVLIGEMSPGSPQMAMAGPAVLAGAPVGTSQGASESASAQTQAMHSAAQVGAPFCEMCGEKEEPPPQPQTQASQAPKSAWLEIAVVDKAGKPMSAEPYRLELPDGSIKEGVLDGGGKLRLEGIDPGKCKIEFPGLTSKAQQ